MIRSSTEQKFRPVVIKLPIFSTEAQIKTGISRDAVGKSKKSSARKYGYFLEQHKYNKINIMTLLIKFLTQ